MATNERFMLLPPEAVWDALSDPYGYGYWVVGSKTIRDADPGWPEPGSRFHHTIAFGPLRLSDHTEALEARPPELLRLRARGRPLGTATVTLVLRRHGGGTVVRLTENPDGLMRPAALNPVTHALTKVRNAESLMRLEELALRR